MSGWQAGSSPHCQARQGSGHAVGLVGNTPGGGGSRAALFRAHQSHPAQFSSNSSSSSFSSGLSQLGPDQKPGQQRHSPVPELESPGIMWLPASKTVNEPLQSQRCQKGACRQQGVCACMPKPLLMPRVPGAP